MLKHLANLCMRHTMTVGHRTQLLTGCSLMVQRCFPVHDGCIPHCRLNERMDYIYPAG